MTTSVKSSEEIEAASKANASSFGGIPPNIGPARRILEHNGIAAEDREKAWSIFPYGCIGSFSFLDMTSVLEDPAFKIVTTRLTKPGSTETFLDVGCCLGTVIRHLAVEGVSAERLYGTDLQPGFLELGYELFGDRDTKATFVAGNMLSDDNSLDVLTGKMDIIYAASFIHLFERDDQLKAARKMISFLRPDNPKALIFGTNGGFKDEDWQKYVLDADAWQSLWDELGTMTGTRWKTGMDWEETETTVRARFLVHRADDGSA
ncbi:hypothetical protein OQA88_5174 [Cercophora sp. LCS_1]